jgi:hypothetical protein
MQSFNENDTPGLVTIGRFGNMTEALMAQGCLDSAGVECFLADTNVARLEWPITRGMRLQVNAEDAEIAAALLEQPPERSDADDSNLA